MTAPKLESYQPASDQKNVASRAVPLLEESRGRIPSFGADDALLVLITRLGRRLSEPTTLSLNFWFKDDWAI